MKFKAILLSAAAATVGLGLMSFAIAESDLNNPQPVATASVPVEPAPLPPFINTSLDWLVKAQFENGGWGSGSHSAQHIKDPSQVAIDPGTTAFAAMALMRSGSSLTEGPYSQNVSAALTYLLELTEAADPNSPYISNVRGTQPQAKLGQNIDASMMVQFYSRILPQVENDMELWGRVKGAMNTCVKKIQGQQQANGSQGGGTWAGALQSSMAQSALEVARTSGAEVDEAAYEKATDYNSSYIDVETKAVNTSTAAGITLYAVSSNQRATARRARKAKQLVAKAKQEGKVQEDAEITEEVIEQAAREEGLNETEIKDLKKGYTANQASYEQMQNDYILTGFGNNGGEEYYSFLQTSEALVITGGEAWNEWSGKMNQRLSKIQNPDGSWSGHHCITSPVFCTAAAILLLTADRDADVLTAEAEGS